MRFVNTTARTFWHRLHVDEDGTSMTEFVIGLPVFIILFVGILNLHSAGVNSVLVKGTAHSKMWVKAIDIQTRFVPEWSTHPISAAGRAAYLHQQTGGNALDYALDSADGIAAASGLSGGIMAHSYSRAAPVALVDSVSPDGKPVTWDLSKEYLIPEEESVSYALMNDAIDYGSFGSITGNGVLGGLNSIVDFGGMRPAIAAGIRYGISLDWDERPVKLFGMPDQQYEARSHVANAPRATSRYITFGVVRLAMERPSTDGRYTTAIAFEWIPDLAMNETMDFARAQDAEDEHRECEESNAAAAAEGGETTDCGGTPEVDDSGDDYRNDFLDDIEAGCRGSLC